jgi:hypothetical protein
MVIHHWVNSVVTPLPARAYVASVFSLFFIRPAAKKSRVSAVKRRSFADILL